MKNNLITKMVRFTFIGTFAFLVCNCNNDDEPQLISGTFNVTNISYSDKYQNSNLEAIIGDTLKVSFTPQNEHRDLQFDIRCDKFEKINDSLFIVSNINSGSQQIELTAACSNTTESGITNYNANKKIAINIAEESATVPYIISASADLLKFVNTEVTYTDSDSKEHTFIIADNEWSAPTNIASEMYTYGFKIRYTKMGIISFVQVRYSPKAGIEKNKENYYFLHMLDRGSADVKIPNLFYIDNYNSISIITTPSINKNSVDSYLSKLYADPDIFKMEIDPKNNILKRIE